MRLALAAALALCACSQGLTHGDMGLTFDGGPIGIPTPSGPSDSGVDGGPDGGADAGDAGCTALSLNSVNVIDGCSASGLSATGSLNVDPSSCVVNLVTGSGSSCFGSASGAHDAFDGGCGGFAGCTSSSLPGTIYCPTSAITSCSVIVDGGP
jgi:hypothetical protein